LIHEKIVVFYTLIYFGDKLAERWCAFSYWAGDIWRSRRRASQLWWVRNRTWLKKTKNTNCTGWRRWSDFWAMSCLRSRWRCYSFWELIFLRSCYLLLTTINLCSWSYCRSRRRRKVVVLFTSIFRWQSCWKEKWLWMCIWSENIWRRGTLWFSMSWFASLLYL